MANKEKVRIDFIMTYSQNGISEQLDFSSSGVRYSTDRKTYILYEEPVIESDVKNYCRITINGNEVNLYRKGLIKMNQTFIPGIKTKGSYKTPYLIMEIDAVTNEFKYNEDKLILSYDLYTDDELLGTYNLQLGIESEVN